MKAESGGRNMREKAGARGIGGIEKAAIRESSVCEPLLVLLLIRGSEKRAQVVIEPPGNLRRRRILEIHDGVFIACKVGFVEKRAGAVHQSVVFIFGIVRDALAMKAGKKRSRTGSVETFVVIENANLQKRVLHSTKFTDQEMTRIAGPGRNVKAEAPARILAASNAVNSLPGNNPAFCCVP
jgi:hypothetical protein